MTNPRRRPDDSEQPKPSPLQETVNRLLVRVEELTAKTVEQAEQLAALRGLPEENEGLRARLTDYEQRIALLERPPQGEDRAESDRRRVDGLADLVRTTADRATAAERRAADALALLETQRAEVARLTEETAGGEELRRRLVALEEARRPEQTPANDEQGRIVREALALAQTQDSERREQVARLDGRTSGIESLLETTRAQVATLLAEAGGAEAVHRQIAALERGITAHQAEVSEARKEEQARTAETLAALHADVLEARARARETQTMAESLVAGLAAKVEELAGAVDTERAKVVDTQLRRLGGEIENVYGVFKGDPILATALSRTGLIVPNSALDDDISAAKITAGDLGSARMSANIPAAINASAGGISAAKVSTGDLPSAQMQTNVITAVNAGTAGTLNGSQLTGALNTAVTIGGNKLTGDLTLAGGQNVGFFGATPVGQQTRGATLTNNVTASGTTDQIDDLTLVDYATDKTILQGDLYQLARVQRQHDVALRALGILT